MKGDYLMSSQEKKQNREMCCVLAFHIEFKATQATIPGLKDGMPH